MSEWDLEVGKDFQLHSYSYRNGKDMRIGQGVKNSSQWKILALDRIAVRENYAQPRFELPRYMLESTPRGGKLESTLRDGTSRNWNEDIVGTRCSLQLHLYILTNL